MRGRCVCALLRVPRLRTTQVRESAFCAHDVFVCARMPGSTVLKKYSPASRCTRVVAARARTVTRDIYSDLLIQTNMWVSSRHDHCVENTQRSVEQRADSDSGTMKKPDPTHNLVCALEPVLLLCRSAHVHRNGPDCARRRLCLVPPAPPNHRQKQAPRSNVCVPHVGIAGASRGAVSHVQRRRIDIPRPNAAGPRPRQRRQQLL